MLSKAWCGRSLYVWVSISLMAGGIGVATDIFRIMTSSRDRRDDDVLLEAIRAGDESAFSELVGRYERSMIRAARGYLGDPTAAEEAVQETWLAVVEGVKRFKHHSSLKTWLFSILINQTRKQAARRPKELPEAQKTAGEDDDVTSEWFDDTGAWRSKPPVWGSTPESELLSKEAVEYIYATITSLPEKQRAVLTLREVEGWTPEEVCDLMKITRTDQRVLLHLAKSRLQQRLDEYFIKRRKAPAAPGTEGSKP